MPEVAEVHRVKDHLRVAVRGRRINQVVLHPGAKVSGLIPTEVVIVEVGVYGKKILFYLSNSHVLIGSLGMTGSFRYLPAKNTRVSLHLSEILEDFSPALAINCSMILYFHDHRMYGDLKMVSSWPLELKNEGYGPDILAAAKSEWISWEAWWKIFSKLTWGLSLGTLSA